jgi:hypothetical protein
MVIESVAMRWVVALGGFIVLYTLGGFIPCAITNHFATFAVLQICLWGALAFMSAITFVGCWLTAFSESGRMSLKPWKYL